LARAEGAIVAGKTVTTEFATFHPGPTRNPHNPAHTPGGSSSGSAAAVADWMVPLAFGSQTAGSIVRPAAFCGVVGFKPTFGMVTRVGVKMISDTLDTVGVLTRSVPDAALFVAALTGRRELLIDGPATDIPRIGLCRTYEWNRAQPETVALLESAGQRLRATGASVREVTLPAPFAGLAQAQTAIMVFEVAKSLSHENLVHRKDLSADMAKMIDAGLAVSPQQYDAARSLTRSCRAMLPDIFNGLMCLSRPVRRATRPLGSMPPAIHCSTVSGRCCTSPSSMCLSLAGRMHCPSASRSWAPSVPIVQRCEARNGYMRGLVEASKRMSEQGCR
jgi:amidase